MNRSPASAVAWTEFRSYPIASNQLLALEQLLPGGIVPYERAHADLAGGTVSDDQEQTGKTAWIP